eukprot:s4018_g11.t1
MWKSGCDRRCSQYYTGSRQWRFRFVAPVQFLILVLHDFLLNPPACGQPAEREPETSSSDGESTPPNDSSPKSGPGVGRLGRQHWILSDGRLQLRGSDECLHAASKMGDSIPYALRIGPCHQSLDQKWEWQVW